MDIYGTNLLYSRSSLSSAISETCVFRCERVNELPVPLLSLVFLVVCWDRRLLGMAPSRADLDQSDFVSHISFKLIKLYVFEFL